MHELPNLLQLNQRCVGKSVYGPHVKSPTRESRRLLLATTTMDVQAIADRAYYHSCSPSSTSLLRSSAKGRWPLAKVAARGRCHGPIQHRTKLCHVEADTQTLHASATKLWYNSDFCSGKGISLISVSSYGAPSANFCRVDADLGSCSCICCIPHPR